MQQLVGRVLAPIGGMAFFWAYFRYQVVFMVLYPQTSSVALGPVTIPSHGAFLLALALLACTALARGYSLERFIRSHPVVCTITAALGTGGGALALWALSSSGAAHTALVWLSAFLVACAFLASFLMWGIALSQDFSATQLVILSTSYLVSLAVFRPGTGIPREAFSLAVPLGSSLCWLVSVRWGMQSLPPAQPTRAQALLNPSIWLFAAFLLAGSVIRGIVDCVIPTFDSRRALSMPITALFTAVCVVYWLVAQHRQRANAPLFVLGCWVGFSCLFFFGVFAFLVADDFALGGSLVVIARSMLEVALWMFLCDYAHRQHAPVVPLFIVGGVFVETASWAISYVAIPALAAPSLNGVADPHMLALLAVFGLVAAITAVCGALLGLQGIQRTGQAPLSHESTSPTNDTQLAAALERSQKLTPRESTVALLYARGYSLSKVAEELGVSTSSAQTSIKSVYRKLGVHSKDELIVSVEELREGCGAAFDAEKRVVSTTCID